MGIPDDIELRTRVVLMAIEKAGFRVSLHRMRDYVEAHAVPATDPEMMLHLARVHGGDGPELVYECVCELARGVQVELPLEP